MRYPNRDARDYEFIDKFEAGLVLNGAEAKSLRVHGAQFNGSKVEVVNGVPTLFNITIQPYKYASNQTVDTTTERQLLLNTKEIAKLISLRHQKYMIIPIAIFLKGKWFKVEIGVGRKMRQYEKREKIRKEEAKRGI
jgi:SsrA-binding protein